MIVANSGNNFVQCLYCHDTDVDFKRNNLPIIVYGHCSPNTEIGKQAEWIHGICQPCLKGDLNLLKNLSSCNICSLEISTQRITLAPDGLLKGMESLDCDLDLKNEKYVAEIELLGKKIERYVEKALLGLAFGAPSEEIDSIEEGEFLGAAVGRFIGKALIEGSEVWSQMLKGIVPTASELENW